MALNYYSNCATLTISCVLYTDSGLTNPVPDNFYSDGTNCFEVTGGIGSITNVTPCPGPPAFNANFTFGTPGTICQYSLTSMVYTNGTNYYYDAGLTSPVYSNGQSWLYGTEESKTTLKTDVNGLSYSTEPCPE